MIQKQGKPKLHFPGTFQCMFEPMPSSALLNPRVRSLLDRILPTDIDLEEFVLDYFEDIKKRRFSTGMDRIEKTNILIAQAGATAILSALRQHRPAETFSVESHCASVPPYYPAPAGEECLFEIVISTRVEVNHKARVEALVEHLRKITGNAEITLYAIKRGSVRFIFRGTRRDCALIKESLGRDDLAEILGIPLQLERIELHGHHGQDEASERERLGRNTLTVCKTIQKVLPGKIGLRSSPYLRVLFSPSYSGREIYPLPMGETTIGRGEAECVLAFPSDTGMSRIHSKIKVSETSGVVFVRNFGKNGTWAGRQCLNKSEDWHPIEDGEILRLGNTLFTVRYEQAEPNDVQIPSLIGVSLVMKHLRAQIACAAGEDSVSILLSGETGTGKEVVARAIHSLSKRSVNPFVAVHCASVPETLAEAEFFGNTGSAFTGAAAREGCFRAADGGSLFLDEIGDTSVALQPRLFRALSEKKFTPLGSEESIVSDFRLIAATNQPLGNEGQSSNFRKELFARFPQFQIHIPPLRDRREDIVPLLLHFYPEAANLLDADFVHALVRHDWPLNVRQLFNIAQQLRIERSTAHVVKRLSQLEDDGEEYQEDELATRQVAAAKESSVERSASADPRPHVVPSKELLHSYMTAHQGNIDRVAQCLGCDRRSVRRYLELHTLRADSYRLELSGQRR